MLIIPNSLELVDFQWHTINMGYFLIGLGFFLICIIEEMAGFYESCLSNRLFKTEKDKLIDSSTIPKQDNQLIRLITLVFTLGVHYFFGI